MDCLYRLGPRLLHLRDDDFSIMKTWEKCLWAIVILLIVCLIVAPKAHAGSGNAVATGTGTSVGDCLVSADNSYSWCGDGIGTATRISVSDGPQPMDRSQPVSASNPLCQVVPECTGTVIVETASGCYGDTVKVTYNCSGGPVNTSGSTAATMGRDTAPVHYCLSSYTGTPTSGSATDPTNSTCQNVCKNAGVNYQSLGVSSAVPGGQLNCKDSVTGAVANVAYTLTCPGGYGAVGLLCTKVDASLPQGVTKATSDGTTTTGYGGSINTNNTVNNVNTVTYNGATPGVAATTSTGGSSNEGGITACAAGQHWDTGGCTTNTCQLGAVMVGTTCVPNNSVCPSGQVWNSTNSTCSAPSSGSGSGSGSGTPTPDSFCADNPTATICQTSTFVGSCGSPPSTSGDALEAATAAATFQMNCVLNPAASDESNLYTAIKTGADPLAGTLPDPAHPTTVDVSGHINSDAFCVGGGSLTDITVPIGDHSIVVPLSSANTWLVYIGYFVLALGFLLAARIVSKVD